MHITVDNMRDKPTVSAWGWSPGAPWGLRGEKVNEWWLDIIDGMKGEQRQCSGEVDRCHLGRVDRCYNQADGVD